jgi:transcriptional antiterminator Rof (Rho-off)
MSKTNGWLVGGLLAAAALLGISERSDAQRDLGRGEARGTIKAVDAGKATITVAFGGGRDTPPADKTFALAKNVEVCVASPRGAGLFNEAKLADLAVGTVVGLSLSADQKVVDSIIAEEPMVRGVLKTVDAKKNTLSLSMQAGRERAAEEQSYVLAADAEILVDDGRGRRHLLREGKIEDLTEGAIVTVRLSLDKKQIRAVLAEGATLSGIIKAVDAEKRSLTLTVRPARGDDAGEEKTVALAKEALVLIDDGKGRRLSLKEAKLADVPVGSTVMAKLSVDQRFVMLLKAEGPSVFGLLKSVDADKRTITIAIPKGRDNPEEKTLTLAKDARVTFNGAETKLGDLKATDNGPLIHLRLTLDQQTVQVVTARPPERR